MVSNAMLPAGVQVFERDWLSSNNILLTDADSATLIDSGYATHAAQTLALIDRALRWRELGEDFTGAPAQDEEFVLMHCDNIQATGFLEHIKLPHYVDFQAELELVRKLRAEAQTMQEAAE